MNGRSLIEMRTQNADVNLTAVRSKWSVTECAGRVVNDRFADASSDAHFADCYHLFKNDFARAIADGHSLLDIPLSYSDNAATVS